MFVDQAAIVGLGGDELGERVLGVADGVGDGGAAEQGHDAAEPEVIAALALAGALARGAAEIGEEAAREIGRGIGELIGVQPAGEP